MLKNKVVNLNDSLLKSRFQNCELIPMTKFPDWWQAATPAHKARLAKLAKTTVGQLGQIAGGHRVCSAHLAGRISNGTAKMSGGLYQLPIVLRSALCPACAACDYARKCEKR